MMNLQHTSSQFNKNSVSHCSLNFEAPHLEYGFLLIMLLLENCKFRS